MYPLVVTNPFIDDFPIKTSIYKGFSMVMLNNQMVLCTQCNEVMPQFGIAELVTVTEK